MRSSFLNLFIQPVLNSFFLLTISRPLSANNSTKKPDSNHYAREKKEKNETLPQEKTGNGVRPLTLDSEYETEKGGRERGRSFHPLGVPITLYLKDHSLALTDSWNASTASKTAKTGRLARFELDQRSKEANKQRNEHLARKLLR